MRRVMDGEGGEISYVVQLEVTGDVKLNAEWFARCIGPGFKVHSLSIDKEFQSISPTIVTLGGNAESCRKVFWKYFSMGKKLVVDGCWYRVKSIRCSDIYTFEATFGDVDQEVDASIEANTAYREHMERSLNRSEFNTLNHKNNGSSSVASLLNVVGDEIVRLQSMFDQYAKGNDWIPLPVAIRAFIEMGSKKEYVDIDCFPPMEQVYYSDFLRLYVHLQQARADGVTDMTSSILNSSDDLDENTIHIENEPIDELRRRRLRHLNETSMFATGINTSSTTTSSSTSSSFKKKVHLPPIIIEPSPSDFIPISLSHDATKVTSSKLYATLTFWDNVRAYSRSKIAKANVRKVFEEASLENMYSFYQENDEKKSIFRSDMYQVLHRVGLVASESWWLVPSHYKLDKFRSIKFYRFSKRICFLPSIYPLFILFLNIFFILLLYYFNFSGTRNLMNSWEMEKTLNKLRGIQWMTF